MEYLISLLFYETDEVGSRIPPSFIFPNWLLLPAYSADRFFIGFRESSISS